MANEITMAFHTHADMSAVQEEVSAGLRNMLGREASRFTYTFSNHFHPFVGELIAQLNKKSLDGVLDPDFLERLKEDFFQALYRPNEDNESIKIDYFPKEIDLSEDGAYAVYNWELFFHVPLTIAVHLSKNQRFAEAQKWFHYIFDPTAQDGQFWRFLAFREEDFRQADELLRLLSKPENELTDEEQRRKQLLLNGYEQLRRNPFNPHVVARTRILAYALNVVMKYLDNLIAWGDSLFRQDTIESINEATQLYVLAANILGPRPERIPRRGTTEPQTFAQLRKNRLNEVGNAMADLENEFPFNASFPATGGVNTDQANSLFGIGRTLYFCLPRNDRLLGYWDMVADRLFKIRHCMNIEGVVRQLPLFQPPIDPGMLVKAAAAGIDVGAIVAGLNPPVSPVRAQLLIQKALEIGAEVRGMGNSLLSALEKKDAEALGRLRQKHEIAIQELTLDSRYLQWKEAEAATEGLLRTRETALERYVFYRRLLGAKEEDLKEATDFSLERRELTEENFDEVYQALVEQYGKEIQAPAYPQLTLAKDDSLASDMGPLSLITSESKEISHLIEARNLGLAASLVDAIRSAVVFIPDTKGNLHFWGLGGTIDIKVGTAIEKGVEVAARGLQMAAAWESAQAGIAARTATYERRADEWIFQANLAARELRQIGRQIISALIREQITRHEYETLKKQIEQMREIDQFLHEKFTNQELYGWMTGELSKIYYEYYRFAFDTARKAEQAMKRELMRPEVEEQTFIKFNYWDAGRKGLLAGEALHLDLKRMEMAFYDVNKREYELTQHISLRQLDPLALLSLKATGSCEVNLPEWLFDLHTPGHYMRRIKNVSLSIPAVTGPYTSVNCTLTLLKSSIRKSPALKDDQYARANGEDDRFVDYYGAIQSIVTSSAQNDSGLFETNLRDERYLPFEGSGVVSAWRLELPSDFRQFDYNTISDVILHIRYTARPGGDQLRKAAVTRLEKIVKDANQAGLTLLFSLKHDFPDEWSQFVADISSQNATFAATVKRAYFPHFTLEKQIKIDAVELHAIVGEGVKSATLAGIDLSELTKTLAAEGVFQLSFTQDQLQNLLQLDQDDFQREDVAIFLLVKYTIE